MPVARSAAWWPADAVALEEASGGASGDGERDGEAAAPDVPQSPTPTALQVVEYYHLDVVGSVRAVTDAQGQVIARHDFLPFGEELAPQNPPVDERLFTGQVRDFGTGLDYFHARQLRVDLGRFTTPDPLTDLAWTGPTLGASNAYEYAMSNPLRFVDPSGMQSGGEARGIDELGILYSIDPDGFLVPYPGGLTFYVKITAPQSSSVTQPLTPMGAGALSFFPGRGPSAGPGVGGAGQPPAANDNNQQQQQSQQQETKQKCKAAEGAAATFGLAAATHEGVAFVLGEASPFAAVFHGLAIAEGVGAGAFGVYAFFICD